MKHNFGCNYIRKSAVVIFIFTFALCLIFLHPDDSDQKLTRATPRKELESETKTVLYWTTTYGNKYPWNSTINCGPKGNLRCQLTDDRDLLNQSHAIVFHGYGSDLAGKEVNFLGKKRFTPVDAPPIRYLDQYWILYMMEPPQVFTGHMGAYDDLFNWTWTYRSDSDVYMPYGRFEMLEKPIKMPNSSEILPPTKTRLVSWIASNCYEVPSRRMDLVRELQKQIPVDIYGKCGNQTCKDSTYNGCKQEVGKSHKFYLALENSVCQDYLTEKTFNAYSSGMVPIVYGSANYNLFLPRGSYININSFPSAKTLADYLLYLDKNPKEYMKFFRWRTYTKLVDYIDYYQAHCRLCEKLHRDYDSRFKKIIPSVKDWLVNNADKNYPVCNEPLVW